MILFLLRYWKFLVGGLFILALLSLHYALVWDAVGKERKGWEAKIAQERAEWEVKRADLAARQQTVITRTLTVYRDRVVKDKEKSDEIEKLVPRAVPPGECMLSGGMRVVHDAAASGNVPGDTDGAIRAAPPVDAPTLAATLAENYAACRAEFTKLLALQSLVQSLKEVKP